MSTLANILRPTVKVILLPIKGLFRLPQLFLIRCGLLTPLTSNILETSVLDPDTGEYENIRFSPYYDFNIIDQNSQCHIRVVLTLGRERLPFDFPKPGIKEIIDLTADVYCKNDGQKTLNISLLSLQIDQHDCDPVSQNQPQQQTVLLVPGQYQGLPTQVTQSIGLSIEENIRFTLIINEQPFGVTGIARRMIV